MEQAETVLHPHAIISELKKNGITHVVWLPDSETNFNVRSVVGGTHQLELVPVSREGETMAIAAGLWVGGKRPVALIQNTGHLRVGRLHPWLGPRRGPAPGDAGGLSRLGPAWH